MKGKFCVVTGLVVLSAAAGALAQVPSIINYQGRLSAGGTNVFNGAGQFKFALVNGGTNLNRQATAVATVSGEFLTQIAVIDGGAGYDELPGITITDATGSNAVAQATIYGGAVTAITVSDAGRHYSSSPVVRIAPPTANYIYQTFWSNDGRSIGGDEPTLPVTIAVKQGLFSAALGDTNLPNMVPVPPLIFTNSDVRLRIWFSDGIVEFQQLYPDQQFTSVGYAMMAAKVQESTITSLNLSTDPSSLSRVSGGVMTSANSRIGIGTNNPRSELDVAGTITASALNVGGIISAGVIRGNGAVPWEVVTSTVQEAFPNTGYLAENDAQVTITLPAAPSVGDVVRVAGKGVGGWIIRGNTGHILHGCPCSGCNSNWVPHESVDAWDGVASSASGRVLVAVRPGAPTKVSTDFGSTWTSRSAANSCFGAASSADGTKLVVTQIDGLIYTSVDSGANWVARESVRSWQGVASSADGNTLLAVASFQQIYVSTDSGTNWTARESSRSWYGVACSADGRKMVATPYGGQIYTSTDSGMTWVPRESGRLWRGVASSADGSKLAAVADGGNIYTSTNYGTNWTARESSRNWYWVSCSADGAKLVAVVYGGQIYISLDSGLTWTASGPAKSWTSCASSADGNGLVAVAYQDRIYTSCFNPLCNCSIIGAQDAAIELQYIGNNTFRLLSREGTITLP